MFLLKQIVTIPVNVKTNDILLEFTLKNEEKLATISGVVAETKPLNCVPSVTGTFCSLIDVRKLFFER